jgi:hypothetical protein
MGVCTPIIHLEDAIIVPEKVAGDRAGKGILRIRIDVHLHCAVIQVFKFSLQAKINEYFGIFLVYRQQVMAGDTILLVLTAQQARRAAGIVWRMAGDAGGGTGEAAPGRTTGETAALGPSRSGDSLALSRVRSASAGSLPLGPEFPSHR